MTQEELLTKQKGLRNRIVAYDEDGMPIWAARSVAAEVIAFKLINHVWHVLANQRGLNCPNNKGLWNVPSGYIDYNEEIEDGAARETHEETGITVDPRSLKIFHLDSHVDPGDLKQNIVAVYWTVYRGDEELTDRFSEENEIADIRWIPIGELDKYKWVSDRHVSRIKKCYEDYISCQYIGSQYCEVEREYYGGGC